MPTTLKRTVLIRTTFHPAIGSGEKYGIPAKWQARVVDGGPRGGEYLHECGTKESAVRGVVRSLQRAGYSGSYRVLAR